MRPLEESEIQQVFEKLFKFVGKNLKNIVDRADQPHCFRLHKKVRASRTRASRRGRPRSRVRALAESPRTSRESSSLRTHPPVCTFRPMGSIDPAPRPPRSAIRPRRSRTTVMRKYPRFRTASVDEAHTISWLNFFG